jgi:hypothetical protein
MFENRPCQKFHHHPKLAGLFPGRVNALDEPFGPDFIDQVRVYIALLEFENEIANIAGFQSRGGLGHEMHAGQADVFQESPV